MPKARIMMLAAVCACSPVPAPELGVDANAQIDGPIALDASTPTDALSSADAHTPGNTPAPARCDPNAEFGAPVAITRINTAASDEFAFLSHDELTMYFSSDRSGTSYDIFQVTRQDRT